MHGVLNFLKPPGMTSHDAVAFVRRVAGTKRVGHTGTLDPAAAGVLPICIGHATRLVEYLQAGRKTYIAEITFGYETDTLDAMGEIVREADASHINLENLRGALDAFRGTIIQSPPLYSAIKQGGKKLYELARAGVEDIEIKTREVEIYALRVTHFVPPDSSTRNRFARAILHIECGGGTYIRSLVRDIGIALNSAATMTFLVRTQNGPFEIDDALTPEECAENIGDKVLPLSEVLAWCARIVIEDDVAVEHLSHGRIVSTEETERAIRANQYYQNMLFAPHQHVTYARMNGINDEHRALFWNTSRTIAALASPSQLVAPIHYKPEKVFFLDRDD